MKPKKYTNKLNLTVSIYALLAFIIVTETGFFAYKYYSQIQAEKILKDEIEVLKKDNSVLSKMANDYTGINGVDRFNITKKYVRHIKDKLGAEVTRADIVSKISKKGQDSVYYIVRLKYDADSLNSLRKLISLLYLDDSIIAVTDVRKSYIQVVIKNHKQKNHKENN